MQKLGTLLALALISMALSGQSNLLLRHPAINNDGSQISFSFQGDIIVENSLDYMAKGTDEQLKAVVEAFLKDLK
jgi:hypothetical protein